MRSRQCRKWRGVCHGVLRDPRDDKARALFLEELAKYGAVPLANFPAAALDLVQLSRAQATRWLPWQQR